MSKQNFIQRFVPTATCRRGRAVLFALLALLAASCERAPLLHLYQPGGGVDVDLPVMEVELDVLWDYELDMGISYDWRAEWYYGWNAEDEKVFGELGYTPPTSFHLRRYHTGFTPYAPHTKVDAPPVISGNRYTAHFDWGYWDILAWNDIKTIDGVQSLRIDETTTLDSVWATTGETLLPSRYQAPRFTRSFYQPEALFAGYARAEYISEDLEGFIWDEEREVWVKEAQLELRPCTYIYLTQVILHNNRGRITKVDANANLSGMARSVNLNTGVTGQDAITTHYNVRFKENCDMKGESVDIVGGRLLTFGMCGINGSRATPSRRDGDGELFVDDGKKHYMDVQLYFSNEKDSTFVFDVTNQVQRRYKGGVLTVELDMDTVPVPSRAGGSSFDAVVEDFEEVKIPEIAL